VCVCVCISDNIHTYILHRYKEQQPCSRFLCTERERELSLEFSLEFSSVRIER